MLYRLPSLFLLLVTVGNDVPLSEKAFKLIPVGHGDEDDDDRRSCQDEEP